MFAHSDALLLNALNDVTKEKWHIVSRFVVLICTVMLKQSFALCEKGVRFLREFVFSFSRLLHSVEESSDFVENGFNYIFILS